MPTPLRTYLYKHIKPVYKSFCPDEVPNTYFFGVM